LAYAADARCRARAVPRPAALLPVPYARAALSCREPHAHDPELSQFGARGMPSWRK
jgi:hypothetical protein